MEGMLLERISFESLVNSHEQVTTSKIVDWLEQGDDIKVSTSNFLIPQNRPEFSTTIDSLPQRIDIVGFDPASAGVLVAGLTAILAWVSTERRHKETLGNGRNDKNSNGGNNDGNDEFCQRLEIGRYCNMPLLQAMEVRGHNFLIVFRECKNRPSHTTVEYYERW